MTYGIFVLATLIVVMFSLIQPVIRELYATNPPPKITVDPGNKTLLYLAFIIITIIAAPLMFIVWLFPRMSEKFRTVLLADLKNS